MNQGPSPVFKVGDLVRPKLDAWGKWFPREPGPISSTVVSIEPVNQCIKLAWPYWWWDPSELEPVEEQL